MPCKLMACCQFFKDNMKEMPIAADYIKKRLCQGNFENCVRHQIFQEFGGGNIPYDLQPDDTEQVQKIIKCLRSRQNMQ